VAHGHPREHQGNEEDRRDRRIPETPGLFLKRTIDVCEQAMAHPAHPDLVHR
jgi:hypothetical protein